MRPRVDLRQGATLQVRQVKHERQGAEYPARVVRAEGDHVVVAAVWTESVDTEHFRFEPGDRSIEHYWRDRWYAIWQVYAADGRCKGWYCNVAAPAVIDGTSITSVDLELDLWVPGSGSAPVRLDEDEFIASGLPDRDPDAAGHAVRALDELHALGREDLRLLLDPPIGSLDAGDTEEWATPHEPGQVVAIRTVTDNQVRWAGPAIILQDSDEVVVYFRPGGTTNKVTLGTRVVTSRRDRELALRAELLAHRFEVVDHTTAEGSGSLVVTHRGEPFSMWLRKDEPSGSYLPAYINIEAPHRRSAIGFDTDDLCLDIQLDANLDWWLKDDDDLEERTSLGIYSSAERQTIRAAAARAILRAETRQPPFDGSWRAWQPDPAWSLPTLPSNWNDGTATEDVR